MSQDQLRPEGELRAQHAQWAGARSRLWGTAPRPRHVAYIPPPQPDRPLMATIPLRTITFVHPFVQRRQIGCKDVAREVALKHNVRLEDMLGPMRSKSLVKARHEAFFRCRSEVTRNNFPVSYPEIGRLFHRDHTTVLYGIRTYAASTGASLPC
jgi:hypothetical protein